MNKDKILILNLGASHFSLSSFFVKNRLKLEKYHTFFLDKEIKDEWQWIESVIDNLSKAFEKGLNIPKKTEVKIILPAHLLLTKSIKVPWVENSRRQQIIAFEAQQNIPYPISEVEWGSHIVSDDGIEIEVLITAIKSDLLNYLCKKLTLLGIKVDGISASTVLNYNTYRFNYPDLSADSLIIDMGSRSSNLIFLNQSTFFIRSLSIGGDSLTRNIADSLGVTITEAEVLKIDYQMGLIKQDDSNHSLLKKTEQEFMTRFCQEITRSIVTSRQYRKRNNPSIIFLTGKASLVPNLVAFIHSKMEVKVKFFDGLKNVVLEDNFGKDIGENIQFQLSEVVGEASKDFLEKPVGIDLTPRALVTERQFSKKKPFLYASAILLSISLVPAVIMLKDSSRQLDQLIENEQIKLNNLQSISDRIALNTENGKKLKHRLQSFESLVNTKFNWINFFSDLQKSMLEIEDVWLDNLYTIRDLNPVKGNHNANKYENFESIQESLNSKISPENDYKIIVKGRLLIRQKKNADSIALAKGINTRINDLLIGITRSSFVKDHQDLNIDFDPIRAGLKLVPFSVTLNIDPEKPL